MRENNKQTLSNIAETLENIFNELWRYEWSSLDNVALRGPENGEESVLDIAPYLSPLKEVSGILKEYIRERKELGHRELFRLGRSLEKLALEIHKRDYGNELRKNKILLFIYQSAKTILDMSINLLEEKVRNINENEK